MVGDEPRHDIGRRTRTERHDDPHGLRGPLLRLRRQREDRDDAGKKRGGDFHHVSIPRKTPLASSVLCSAFASMSDGARSWARARWAAVPAASPITKQAPETRAAD